ncbi:nitrous oxide-stimulated promoter family protein [Lachnoanaerobaculum sp. MSX33]|uniref:nitrous oxide-stimulated promoter family protein n=1 Tax=Lachnoanaerobaculum sp. MSX33 TaxID=936596 RepID=UPI000A012200
MQKKRQGEIQLVSQMVELYCRGKHQRLYNKKLCHECQGLLDYARLRIEHCPFIESKTFCNTCKVHCYANQMRQKIKEVMRYSGPHMVFSHPFVCIRHAFSTLSQKQK